MKIRGSDRAAEKIETQMAPMIDVVFQLLIFFMLTLKIITPEGDFSINMPIGTPDQMIEQELTLTEIKVRLIAAPDGSLARLQLGPNILGNDALAFERLNLEILKLTQGGRGLFAKETEVEIDADYNLDYQYIIRAVSACTGRVDPATNQIVRYVEKIKFAPPRRPTE